MGLYSASVSSLFITKVKVDGYNYADVNECGGLLVYLPDGLAGFTLLTLPRVYC